MAHEMTCVHNTFTRGFNSILVQGPHVPSAKQPGYKAKDVRDLLTFTDCLLLSLHHHHESEENVLFPALERESAAPGYLSAATEGHATFHDGFNALWAYVKETLDEPERWTWVETQKLFDVFMPALMIHLTEEIDLLLTMEKFEEAGLRKAWDETVEEAKKVGIAGLVSVFHFHFLLLLLLLLELLAETLPGMISIRFFPLSLDVMTGHLHLDPHSHLCQTRSGIWCITGRRGCTTARGGSALATSGRGQDRYFF